MNIAEIKTNDIANGEGVRTSVFVSGCRHHCPDCFNEIAWDFEYGKPWNYLILLRAAVDSGLIFAWRRAVRARKSRGLAFTDARF